MRRDRLIEALLVLGVLLVIACIVVVSWAMRQPATPRTVVSPALPNHALTPGAVFPVTKAEVCVPGYTAKVRHVTVSVRKKVFAEYGIPYADASKYEVDHLISLELGGSNDIKNLWPEFGPRPNPKDAVENRLHAQVCNGTIPLARAQKLIAADWRVVATMLHLSTVTAS